MNSPQGCQRKAYQTPFHFTTTAITTTGQNVASLLVVLVVLVLVLVLLVVLVLLLLVLLVVLLEVVLVVLVLLVVLLVVVLVVLLVVLLVNGAPCLPDLPMLMPTALLMPALQAAVLT
jgi:hypothetical protein